MDYAKIDFKKAISIYWSLLWRWVLYAGIANTALASAISPVLQVSGASPFTAFIVSALLSILIGVPVCIWVVQNALSIERNGYSVVLMKLPDANEEKQSA